MRKKLLLLFVSSLVGFAMAQADEPIKGIIATYNGAETSYMLADVPAIKYEDIAGTKHAVIYLKDKPEPVLSVALAEGKQLLVVYGIYTPTSIEGETLGKTSVTERDGKKYIQGGRLIIISKDGKKYDFNGVEIK